MKLFITLSLSAVFILSAAHPAAACLCLARSVSQKKKDAAAVFMGTVVENEKEINDSGISYRIKFTVERSWKNAEVSEIIVYTRGGCLAWFEVGKKYLVYAYAKKEKGLLGADMCSVARLADLSAKDLKRLGNGKAITASTIDSIK
ncbi:MAG: hypothetical protein ABR554_08115 [Pyrinomonadaceae bacterium]